MAGQPSYHGRRMRAPDDRLLPAELVWLSALGPPVCSVLIDRSMLWSPWAVALRHIAANYIPFVAAPLTFQLLYRFVMPRLLARVQSRAGRILLHSSVVTVAAALVAQAILPLHRWAIQKNDQRLEFTLICVVLSWLFLFPALLVQSWRRRTRAMELAMMAERQVALQAQLSALQARTNPHFFFNSVNTVASLIPDDPVLAERTLERLADLFRYALDSSRTPLVPLEREIDMVRDYLAIQTARFGSRLISEVTLDPAVAATTVPPLLLQPLVENAILHGLGERRHVSVAIGARREGDDLIIEVKDDGPGPGASSHRGTGTSIDDLAQRMRLLYGERGGFALEPGEAGGCIARLRLPVLATP